MKLKFDEKVEFYITNVCNYTCDNCNRFNNHKFSGWQRWSDYEGIYRQWAERIELQAITIGAVCVFMTPIYTTRISIEHKI